MAAAYGGEEDEGFGFQTGAANPVNPNAATSWSAQ